MAQLDYPIPLLDRGWELWADDLGSDAKLSTIISVDACHGILGQSPPNAG